MIFVKHHLVLVVIVLVTRPLRDAVGHCNVWKSMKVRAGVVCIIVGERVMEQ